MDNYKTSERDGVRVQAPLVDRVIMTDISNIKNHIIYVVRYTKKGIDIICLKIS